MELSLSLSQMKNNLTLFLFLSFLYFSFFLFLSFLSFSLFKSSPRAQST